MKSQAITSFAKLEEFGRTWLSENFFMRDFLYSEIANFHGLPNIPDDPARTVEARARLCAELLEPLRTAFGHVAIRSAYRSPTVNHFGNEHGMSCARNESNYASHIWDHRDSVGRMGATASSFRGSPTASRPARTGGGWLGGSMTTSPIRPCSSSQRRRHSTSNGARSRSGRSAATSHHAAA